MISTEEKALELFKMYESLGRDFTRGVSMKEFAKECCIMAVDQIIESRKDDKKFDDRLYQSGSSYASIHPMYLSYWLEVKDHLKKI